MAKERRDSKNRILRAGEYQRSDGRYMYRYKDVRGEDRFVYSWTLTKTDRTPPGKQAGKCLRDLELEIASDIHDWIDSYSAQKATLNHCFDQYMGSKTRIKKTTRQDYMYMYDTYVRETVGLFRISEIRYSQMMGFYSDLLTEKQLAIGTISIIFNVINPVFRTAVRDRLIRDNPQTGILAELKKGDEWKPLKRHALTVAQQKAFFDYIKNHKKFRKWWPVLTGAVGTGCRVGELVALTWDDCDFTNGVIYVRKNLVYYKNEETGEVERHISTPKTKAGVREVPMVPEIREMLLKEKKRQLKYGFCTETIDGYSGFVFTSMHNKVIHPRTITHVVQRFIMLYNDEEAAKAKLEKRTPVLLPKFSAHTFRHTFCTRLCESGVNIKVVQEVMGHSSSVITMDIYNDATQETVQKEFESLEQKVIVS